MFKRNQGQIEFADQWFATGMINQTLESLDRLINWEPIRNRFAKVYAPHKNGGRPGFDPVMLLKLLLLEAWYDLSDGRALEEASDRLSFRRFLGMGVADLLPDDTTLVRFRARLLEHDDLLSEVLDYVNACIQRHGFSLNTGKIIDATLVKARTRPRQNGSEKEIEPEADKTVKNGKPHHGYKVHMATDAETNVITDVDVTPASHHDATVFEQFLTGEEPSVYADKAYDGEKRRQRLKEDGTEDCIMKRAARGHPLSDEAKAVNRIISKIRSRIERKIGELKLWHGFSRMRYIGLARSKIQTFLVVIVVNLKFLVARFA